MGCTSFQACLGVPRYDSTCGSKIRSRPRRGGTSFAGENVLRGTFRHANLTLIWEIPQISDLSQKQPSRGDAEEAQGRADDDILGRPVYRWEALGLGSSA